MSKSRFAKTRLLPVISLLLLNPLYLFYCISKKLSDGGFIITFPFWKILKTTYCPTIRCRKIVKRFKRKISFLLKSDSLFGGNKNHSMGQAAGRDLTPHGRIVEWILIRSRCRGSKDLQSRTHEGVNSIQIQRKSRIFSRVWK